MPRRSQHLPAAAGPRTLRSLDLTAHMGADGITRRGWRAIRVALSCAASLTELNLTNLPNADLDKLVLPHLETLTVTACGVDGVLGGTFPRLKRLCARDSRRLTGVAPGLLPPCLEFLDLSFCFRLGPLPDLSGCAASLRELRLRELRCLELLPPLPRLEVLDVAECELEALPFCCGDCPMLKELGLSGFRGDLTGGLLSPAMAPRLEKLDLSAVRRGLPPQLHLFSALKDLDLSRNNWLTQLPPLPAGIERLRLSGNIGVLNLPPTLTALTMSCSRADDVELPAGLEELRLVNCTAARSVDWAGLTRLRVLDVSHNRGGLSLGRLEQLEELVVSDCGLTELPTDVAALWPRLRKLDVTGNGRLVIPSSGGSALDSLEELRMVNCGRAALSDIAALFPRLRKLDVSGCHLPAGTPARLDYLEELYVSECRLTARPPGVFPRLRKLDGLQEPSDLELEAAAGAGSALQQRLRAALANMEG